jgi:hypothetical protein
VNRTIITSILALFIVVAAHAQLSDTQIVNKAFPTTLDDRDGVRFSRFIAVDLNRNGQPLLVAVYTNGAAGAIRVLDRAGQILAAPALPGMRGFHATVQALDLDGDGTPEIIAEFTTGHSPDNPDTWVFRWAGSGLQLISPTCAVGNLLLTCLGHVSPVDIDGSGRFALLDSPAFTIKNGGVVSADGNWSLYTLNGGTFSETPQTFQFGREFKRGNGKPFTSTRKFPGSPGAATLRVINGTGAAASTSGQVALNGKDLLGPADFKRNQHVYDVPVALAQDNSLTVRLDGKPGSKITVLILGTNMANGTP